MNEHLKDSMNMLGLSLAMIAFFLTAEKFSYGYWVSAAAIVIFSIFTVVEAISAMKS